jgi:diguanylate cyclase (GGDEF)-like protein/PAS domain S-box-containing protein
MSWNAAHPDPPTASMNHRAELRAPPELLRLLADNVPALVAYYEAPDFRCVFANRRYAQTFGFSEQSIIGRTLREVGGAEAIGTIQPLLDDVVEHRAPATHVRELPAGAGRPARWIEVHVLPHLDAGGAAVLGAFVLIDDITRHRLAERSVRESEDRLTKFMQASCEGIVFHKDGVITDVNPPLLALTGHARDELLGRPALDFVAPDHVAKAASVIASGEELTYESVILHKDGTRIDVEFIVRTMMRNGERLRMTIVRDIRDRHAAQARIRYMAHHDALTGLPNRLHFNEQLERLMQAARQHGRPLALLFIDLDHFKRVNDSLGHPVGDALLKTLADRITASLSPTDLVARFGGDEFMVLLPGIESRGQVADVAGRLHRAIEAPVDADGRTISVTPSIGVAMFPGDGHNADELIKHADTAMYSAKASGRANVQFFDPAVASAAYAALITESELAQALARDEFVLQFQPQVRAHDGVLSGAEALIRWRHPTRGLLAPDDFIPVAEQHRLMLPIGQWVLREAARCARRWHAANAARPPLTVAVNLSNMQFHAPGFVESVERVLAEEQVPGTWLEIELTERMLLDDLPEVRRALGRLRATGIRISIDDFGTGYSSLGHLRDLPLDKLKIDRSFVCDLPQQRDAAAIAQAIVTMAKALGLTVIAEGVETEAQRALLAELGCDELQGDAVGAVQSAEAIERQVAREPATCAAPRPTSP